MSIVMHSQQKGRDRGRMTYDKTWTVGAGSQQSDGKQFPCLRWTIRNDEVEFFFPTVKVCWQYPDEWYGETKLTKGMPYPT